VQNVGGDHEESHGSNRLHLNNRRKPLTRSRTLRYGPVKLKHYNVDRGESPLLNVGTTIEVPLTSDQMLELHAPTASGLGLVRAAGSVWSRREAGTS
jgi:hypothetical protein